jgi:hypothetical protein
MIDMCYRLVFVTIFILLICISFIFGIVFVNIDNYTDIGKIILGCCGLGFILWLLCICMCLHPYDFNTKVSSSPIDDESRV